ncbi:MAG: Jag N-terminal domain-containing protein [Proteobacteria bacterium]|nr:Jag N-terminal domain-containing protein [Pseudomonadota bacterium]MBU2227489.1 Jag N-terminal domain-containing protein [Pseudomonadota bacterium]
MEGIEIEGKSIDEAIEKACGEFQVPREKLHIEIISEGTPGFLGLGAKKARIRAALLTLDMTLDAPAVRPEEEVETPEPTALTAAATPEQKKAQASPIRKEKRVAAPVEKSHPARVPVGGEPSAAKARMIMEGLLTRMQIESPVAVEETGEAIILNIQGDGSGLLIGKRGQNLDAIQYFVNKAAHHSANGHKMIIIDTEDYRKRREESLVALAMRLGEKAKKTKKPVTVGQMNARDRRIIHLAMQNDEALTTKSRGEGEYRKIIIIPVRRGSDHPAA